MHLRCWPVGLFRVRRHNSRILTRVGRNKGSQTGVVVTHPAICQACGRTFPILGKRRTDGPRPAKYCSHRCYTDSNKGHGQPPQLKGKGGAPKGREPWNKGSVCPQLAGERNGMFGRTHTPETRTLLSRLTSSQLSELSRQRVAVTQAPLARSDPEYSRLFRLGWRSIRRTALERDGHACAICGAHRARMNVHHIEPFSLVLKHELENLVTLCTSCHNQVHRGAAALLA